MFSTDHSLDKIVVLGWIDQSLGGIVYRLDTVALHRQQATTSNKLLHIRICYKWSFTCKEYDLCVHEALCYVPLKWGVVCLICHVQPSKSPSVGDVTCITETRPLSMPRRLCVLLDENVVFFCLNYFKHDNPS